MAVALGTTLSPLELLRAMLGIEKEMGRVRDIRYGPRVIDLDLLLYEDVGMETDELTLPHPRMGERSFVLVPLEDVWAGEEAGYPWKEWTTEDAMKREGIRIWSP